VLNNLAQSIVDSALSLRTIACYGTGTKQYLRFCRDRGITPFPTSIDILTMFFTYICLFVDVSSGIKYLSAVRSSQLDLGHPWWFPCRERLQRCIKSLKKRYPASGQMAKYPITTAILLMFLPFLNFRLHADRLFWAASCCAVYQLWRGSEFLVHKQRPGPEENPLLKTHLSWHDPERTHCSTNLLHTKTKWWRDDIQTQAWKNTSPTSPTDALVSYLDGAPAAAANSPWLFANKDGSILRRAQIIKRTRTLAGKCGLDPSKFIASSWRAGGATSAHEARMSPALIRALGRWDSDAYLRYIAVCPNDLQNAGIMMSGSSSALL
jgi:hypothetical protein